MSTHSEEPARQLPENPDLRHLKDQAKDILKAGQAPTLAKVALTAAKTVIRWLRWAAVLGLVYATWRGLVFDVVQMVGVLSGLFFLLVAAGAKIAPRNRLITAIVLAAVLVWHSF